MVEFDAKKLFGLRTVKYEKRVHPEAACQKVWLTISASHAIVVCLVRAFTPQMAVFIAVVMLSLWFRDPKRHPVTAPRK